MVLSDCALTTTILRRKFLEHPEIRRGAIRVNAIAQAARLNVVCCRGRVRLVQLSMKVKDMA